MVTTPSVKQKVEDLMAESPPLGSREAKLYHSVTMRAQYLAQDRPHLQFAGKERQGT